jgi:hypothetical protein
MSHAITGTANQQKRALAMLFEHLSVDLTGNTKEAEPQSWVQPLFVDEALLDTWSIRVGPRTETASPAAPRD